MTNLSQKYAVKYEKNVVIGYALIFYAFFKVAFSVTNIFQI